MHLAARRPSAATALPSNPMLLCGLLYVPRPALPPRRHACLPAATRRTAAPRTQMLRLLPGHQPSAVPPCALLKVDWFPLRARLGEAIVDQHTSPRRPAEQVVAGLDVAVDHAVVVRVPQRDEEAAQVLLEHGDAQLADKGLLKVVMFKVLQHQGHAELVAKPAQHAHDIVSAAQCPQVVNLVHDSVLRRCRVDVFERHHWSVVGGVVRGRGGGGGGARGGRARGGARREHGCTRESPGCRSTPAIAHRTAHTAKAAHPVKQATTGSGTRGHGSGGEHPCLVDDAERSAADTVDDTVHVSARRVGDVVPWPGRT